MATQTTTLWSEILAVGLRGIFQAHMKDVEFYGERILVVKDSKKQKEDFLTTGGFGLAAARAETAPIAVDDPTQGYTKSFIHVNYANGFQVSETLNDDDLYGIVKGWPRELANSMARTAEYYMASIFNNAFTAGAYAIADGLALCSTAHTQLDGNTYANKPSTDIDLSTTALEAAFENMMLIEDDRSNPIPYVPKILVCHPNDMFTAKKILGSQLDPDSANNTINPLQGSLELVVWPYLTDTDAWFVLCDKKFRDFGPMHIWRKRPDFKQDTTISTRIAVYNSVMRFIDGAVDWRGTYGSSGG